jgi:hypothetical protein
METLSGREIFEAGPVKDGHLWKLNECGPKLSCNGRGDSLDIFHNVWRQKLGIMSRGGYCATPQECPLGLNIEKQPSHSLLGQTAFSAIYILAACNLGPGFIWHPNPGTPAMATGDTADGPLSLPPMHAPVSNPTLATPTPVQASPSLNPPPPPMLMVILSNPSWPNTTCRMLIKFSPPIVFKKCSHE